VSQLATALERHARPINALLLAGWILGLNPGLGHEYRDVAVFASLEEAQARAAAAESVFDGSLLDWGPGPAPFTGVMAVGRLGVWVIDHRAEALVIYEKSAAMKERRKVWAKQRAEKRNP
jgi:hypothetical protein